jgi:hypothetical protein
MPCASAPIQHNICLADVPFLQRNYEQLLIVDTRSIAHNGRHGLSRAHLYGMPSVLNLDPSPAALSKKTDSQATSPTNALRAPGRHYQIALSRYWQTRVWREFDIVVLSRPLVGSVVVLRGNDNLTQIWQG